MLPKRGLVQAVTFSLDEIKGIVDSASSRTRRSIQSLRKPEFEGEICGLRVADLDLETGVIHVRQSVWRGKIQTVKSRKGNRRFPISAQLAEHLRAYLQTWRPNNLWLLFSTGNGTPWDHGLGSKAEVSSSPKEVGHSTVRLPCFPPWKRYAAPPDWLTYGGAAQTPGPCRGTNHHGVPTRSHGRRAQDCRRPWENSARYCTE